MTDAEHASGIGSFEPPVAPASLKRKALRDGLGSGRLLRLPGAFTPLSAPLIEGYGFDGVYISGGVLSAELGLPDIGLTTMSEVSGRAEQIAAATSLPTMLDIDTGFGAPLNAARTVETLERKGISGCHIEDQVNPKRCGHLDGKQLVGVEDMVQRVAAAARARTDPNFVICARTDARAVEGFDAVVARAKAYLAAGADMIFPEALADEGEFVEFHKAVDAPLLANMTEFGKSKLLDAQTLSNIGFNMVIYPVTLLRIAIGAIEQGLSEIKTQGHQRGLVDAMQTRKRLYELVDYEHYNEFDNHIFSFDVPTGVEGGNRTEGRQA